jgi:anionic cell wall polymer biosynthesis LytR-Cps2A-Psr (LCP) family protein
MSKKLIAFIIFLIIIITACLAISNFYTQGKEKFDKNYNVLLLTVDPSEQRPGIGAVDMAFVVNVDHGKVVNMTSIYPGGLTHPTLSPPAELRSLGVNKLYLHDALWDKDPAKGAKIAQEIVEYHTGLKTDLVVIVTPTAIDSLIQAIGPVYVQGQGYVTGNSINFLREEQAEMSRGKAIKSLMDGIKNAAQGKDKRMALIKAASAQYAQGNIIVIPPDAFREFVTYEGINNLF